MTLTQGLAEDQGEEAEGAEKEEVVEASQLAKKKRKAKELEVEKPIEKLVIQPQQKPTILTTSLAQGQPPHKKKKPRSLRERGH